MIAALVVLAILVAPLVLAAAWDRLWPKRPLPPERELAQPPEPSALEVEMAAILARPKRVEVTDVRPRGMV